ncbi:MAG TPA: hypothetical protein VFQ61_26130, partial [Polyangiaceae bacterium]|nr:hypothetical protein [Polyangiaceae bacterium]
MNLRLNWAGPSVLVLISACAAPTQEPSQNTAAQSGEAQSEEIGQTTPTLLTADVARSTDPKQALAPRALLRHRSRKDPDAKRHATGRRELTPQESQAYKLTTPKVVAVRPTQLLVERMREASALKSAEAKTLESNVVPFGNDIVTASPGEASAPVPLAAATALPRAVDNSTSPAFPEIRDQGSENSCVAFAVGYYQYTYALGKLLGWNNKNSINTTKVSPKFLYNLANSGGDYGTGPGTVHDILRTQGALTWSEFPYSGDASNPTNYLAWPTTAALWKSALRYKSLGPASVGSPTEPGGIEQAKSLLANGQVLTFSTYIYSWEFEQVDNDPSTSADDGLVGQQIATWQNGSDGGHEATLVGYNDDLWVDINANGVVDSGEKGAFKIANSWGASWKNAGYAWVAYDALRAVSQVPNGPSSDLRMPLIGGIMALAGANTNYQPKLLAEFTVSTASRGELRLALQQTELDRADPVDEYQPTMFQFGGGNYAFD